MRLPYDLSKTARVATVLLLVYCVAEAAFAWHSYILYGFYNVVEAGLLSNAELDAEAARIDGTGVLVAVVFLIVLISCYIVSGMWIFRASSNAQFVEPDPEAIRPGWAVGWFAIPFANFVMPYKSMGQTWARLAGRDGPSWPSWGIIWWVFWLISTIVAGVGNRINLSAETFDQYRLGATLDIISSLASIPAAILFRKLILEVTALSAEARPASTPDLEEGHP